MAGGEWPGEVGFAAFAFSRSRKRHVKVTHFFSCRVILKNGIVIDITY